MANNNEICLTSITFNDGTVIDLNDNTILLITGANNCGKSQTLFDINSLNRDMVVLDEVSIKFRGDMQPILHDVAERLNKKSKNSFVEEFLKAWDGDIISFINNLDKDRRVQGFASSYFAQFLQTYNRTIGIDPNDGPSESSFPFKYIHESKKLEEKLHDLIKSAFGTGVVYNRYSFSDRNLRFISKEDMPSNIDRDEVNFVNWIEDQPSLEEQGDGTRAFCTIITSILCQSRPLVLIDEPEAFLHPPASASFSPSNRA